MTTTKIDIIAAKWEFSHCPTMGDDGAVGCTLVASNGDRLAACLWSAGDLDVDSDGCGVWGDLDPDEVEWPEEEEAMAAVWGHDGGRVVRDED
jgi:hypothetical protein